VAVNGLSQDGNPKTITKYNMNNTTKINLTQNTNFSPEEKIIAGTEKGSISSVGSLPCQYRNNSIETTQKAIQKSFKIRASKEETLKIKYRKTATALSYNVQEFSIKYGLENLGFLTLTFKDHVTDFKLASKRFNSLASNVLNVRYQAWLKVSERHKSGRIHYHLIIALHKNIRTNFDFAQISQHNYSSANDYLKSEWAFWRSTAPKFKFGRTELLPIKSSHEAIGKYVGKYIGKHMIERHVSDKGARLVSYSKGCRTMTTKFSWFTPPAAQWRAKVKIFAYTISRKTGCEPTFAGLKEQLGPKWAYNHRQMIMDITL
jgi:hypothetical protein